jgi:uncharacterized protein (TIGR02246 family)
MADTCHGFDTHKQQRRARQPMIKAYSLVATSIIFFSWLPALNAQTGDRAKDEEAVRAAAVAYQTAFNQGDARALAQMWVEDGEYIDQTTLLMRGRNVIEKAFEGFFDRNKGLTLEIQIDAIRFLADDVISETGTTRTLSANGEPLAEGRYSIIHARRNGGWLMLSVHEQPPFPPSNYEKLKDLEWLVGDWIDEHPDSGSPDAPVIQINSYWSVNRNFIIREFTATVGGTVSTVGTQRIGWHAPSGQIRSWAFDSEGGIITGTWVKQGDGWTVSSSEALSDGNVVTATESVKQNTDGSQDWSVTGREMAGKSLPDETFKLVRMRN